MKTFYFVLIFFAVSSNIFVPANIQPLTERDGYTRGQSPSDDEICVTQYPQVSYLPEATQRLLDGNASRWLLASVYHTDGSIEDVTKFFKTQAQKGNKQAEGRGFKSLLRDNWKVNQGRVNSAPSVFGVGHELRASTLAERVETSLGIIVLDDCVVWVHLMSPHPASANNNKLTSGTMIILTKERIVQPDEKVYNPRDVTRNARVKFKPQPDYVPRGIIGTVVLSAVFSASGKVTNIRATKGLPGGLTEAAIKAASGITFEPAIKDGRYVSVFARLEYNFLR